MSYSSRESTVYRGPVSDEKWLAEGKINLDLPNNVDVESSSSEEEQDVNTTTTSMMHQAGSLIAPWRKLQKSIKSSLPKILLTLAPSYSRSDIKKRSTPVNIIKELNNLKHDASQTQSVPALPIVIPYGFMQTKSIPHPHEALKLAIHVPGAHGEIYATADSKNVYLWRGSVKLSTFSVSGAKSPDNSCFGLTKWIYIKKWRIIVLATSQLELKILDYNLSELYSTSCIKPVLRWVVIEEGGVVAQ